MFEAWIEGVAGVRFTTITATGIRDAYSQAVAECAEGEFVRGVNPLEDE